MMRIKKMGFLFAVVILHAERNFLLDDVVRLLSFVRNDRRK